MTMSDVNPLQEQLIRLIFDCGANLCVVGDNDQTIYNGAAVKSATSSPLPAATPTSSKFGSMRTFRSNSAVINTALAVIELNPERLPKRMESTDAQPFAYRDSPSALIPSPLKRNGLREKSRSFSLPVLGATIVKEPSQWPHL